LVPLTIGSIDTFELSASLDGVPWNLAGGTVSVLLSDPNGNPTNFSASISADGYKATALWNVFGPAGSWLRAWKVIDVNGVTQYSQPIPFSVISSPI
jgi:hypothetical protein